MPKAGTLLEKVEIKLDASMKQGLSEFNAPADMKRIEDINKRVRISRIVYWSGGHKVRGFMAEPRNAKGKLPCIIWNRGGSGDFGSIKLTHAFRWMGNMADWGYIVIATQYSGCGGSEGKEDWGGPVTMADVLNLKLILEKTPKADTKRIGMYGASRGGMMTYRSLTMVKWIKAAVTVAGLADAARMLKLRPDMVKIFKFYGLTKKDLALRSALAWPQKFSKKTPLLMLHGTGDWRVSYLDSLELSQKLYENKVPHKFIGFEGADHSISEHRDERNRATREWFDRYLRDGAPLPELKLHGE